MRTIAVALLCVSYAAVAQRESGGVPLVSFAGSGQESIQAMVADAQGNIYIAGTTTSPDFPVVAAWQPQIAESSAMRSADSGANWAKLTTPSAGLQTIQPDPMNAQILFGASLTAIYKSTDAGQSWRTVFSWAPVLYSTASSLVIDPGNTRRLAAATPAGFLVSLDGGETWAQPGSQRPTCYGSRVTVDPLGSGTIALGGPLYGLCISRDWGVTFQYANPTTMGGAGTIAAFDPWHSGWIYAAMAGGTQGYLYLSTDSVRTWTQKTALPSVYFTDVASLSADPDQPNVWYAATGEGQLWRSPDGMASWTQLQPIEFLTLPSTSMAALSRSCGHGGGLFGIGGPDSPAPGQILSSPDFGATWFASTIGNVDDFAVGGCNLYAGRQIASDVFVAKLAPGGTEVLWATFLGGSALDAPQAVALDGSGNLWVLGKTRSVDFPSTAPRIGVQGTQNAFLARFDPTGALLSSVLIGGEAIDTPSALAMDAAGSVYIAGATTSAQFPVTPGAYQTQPQGSIFESGFIAKIGADLKLVYGSYAAYNPTALAVDAAGQVIVGITTPAGNSRLRLDL